MGGFLEGSLEEGPVKDRPQNREDSDQKGMARGCKAGVCKEAHQETESDEDHHVYVLVHGVPNQSAAYITSLICAIVSEDCEEDENHDEEEDHEGFLLPIDSELRPVNT